MKRKEDKALRELLERQFQTYVEGHESDEELAQKIIGQLPEHATLRERSSAIFGEKTLRERIAVFSHGETLRQRLLRLADNPVSCALSQWVAAISMSAAALSLACHSDSVLLMCASLAAVLAAVAWATVGTMQSVGEY